MDYVKYIREFVGHNKLIMNASGAIIVKNDKILLQRRSDNGAWGLIGGIMEIGETYHETAIREIKEETNLDVELEYLVGIYNSFNMEWPNKDKAHVICAIYKANIIGGNLSCDEESLELRFFGKDEMPDIPAVDHKKAIADYFLGRSNIIE